MKTQDYLILGGLALGAYYLFSQFKKSTDVAGYIGQEVQHAETAAQGAGSNIIGDIAASVANILPTNTAGGTINMGFTGTGAKNSPTPDYTPPPDFSSAGSWQNWVHQNFADLQASNPGIVDPGPYNPLAANSLYASQQAMYSAAAIGTTNPPPVLQGPTLNNSAPLDGNNIYHAAEQIITPTNFVPASAILGGVIPNNGSLPADQDPYVSGPQELWSNGKHYFFDQGQGIYRLTAENFNYQ